MPKSITSGLETTLAMSDADSEETPLLNRTKPAPGPWSPVQLIILFLMLVEPFSSQLISPFVPELIREIGITHGNETHVGYYAGMLHSVFYLCEAVGVLFWGRLSDRIGRKPVILFGLVGISISSLSFGLSKSIWGLILSRCLCGALNGNAGVIKTMLPELTTPENLPAVWACLPLSWTIGATLGPIVGGYFSRPAERYPHIFGNIQFFKTYPYFLPCAVPLMFSTVAWIIVFYLLKETVESPVPISHLFRNKSQQGESSRRVPLRHVLNSRVIISIGHYALVAFLEMAYRAVQPLFFATPIELGGLELPPPSIGKILAAGVAVGAAQIFVFPFVHRRWGDKGTFVNGLAGTIPMFLTFPIAHWLVKVYGFNYLLWAALTLQSIIPFGYGFSFGTIFMYINAAAPDRASLGTTHGLSQMMISLMRAFGPATVNSLFSLSIEYGYLGGNLVYYVFFIVTCVGVAAANYLLPQKVLNQS